MKCDFMKRWSANVELRGSVARGVVAREIIGENVAVSKMLIWLNRGSYYKIKVAQSKSRIIIDGTLKTVRPRAKCRNTLVIVSK
jgi:hypothetical protein